MILFHRDVFFIKEIFGTLGNISPAKDKFTTEESEAHKNIHHYIRKPPAKTRRIHRRENRIL